MRFFFSKLFVRPATRSGLRTCQTMHHPSTYGIARYLLSLILLIVPLCLIGGLLVGDLSLVSLLSVIGLFFIVPVVLGACHSRKHMPSSLQAPLHPAPAIVISRE